MIKQIGIAELDELLDDGITLVDVRMPDEFEQRHVPGAVLIPLPSLPERFDEIPSDDTVYVICQSGGRSMNACEFLEGRGYDTRNVAGGTLAWADSGRPTEAGGSSEPGNVRG